MGHDARVKSSIQAISSLVMLGLIVVVVIGDRIGGIFSPEYEPIGDAALGLMLGALFALVGVQGVDFLRKNGS